jgi:PAS domain S-box-containing protein
VGPDGTILWANQTESTCLGYTAEEYIGRKIAGFHAKPIIEDIMLRLTRGETLLNDEAGLRCKDGPVCHVLINSNVLWRDDQLLHTRCFTRDITERKAGRRPPRRLADIVENCSGRRRIAVSQAGVTGCSLEWIEDNGRRRWRRSRL